MHINRTEVDIRLMPLTSSRRSATMNNVIDTTHWRARRRIRILTEMRNWECWMSIPRTETSLLPHSHSLRACRMTTLIRSKQCSIVSNLTRPKANLYIQTYVESEWNREGWKIRRLLKCSLCTIWKHSRRNGHQHLCKSKRKTAYFASEWIIENWRQWQSETRNRYCARTNVLTCCGTLPYFNIACQPQLSAGPNFKKRLRQDRAYFSPPAFPLFPKSFLDWKCPSDGSMADERRMKVRWQSTFIHLVDIVIYSPTPSELIA